MKECQQRNPKNIEVMQSAKFLLKEIHGTLDFFGNFGAESAFVVLTQVHRHC